jgi:hypothetical protein
VFLADWHVDRKAPSRAAVAMNQGLGTLVGTARYKRIVSELVQSSNRNRVWSNESS